MNFCILYPSEPFQIRKVDEPFKEERDHVHALGLLSALLSYEDLQQGKWKLSGDLPSDTRVIYRGWMLTVPEHQTFERLAMARGLKPLTSSEQYQRTHHLPFWYPLLKEHTPESRFFENAREAIQCMQDVSWKAFFVKDWVKSLSTGRGPVAHRLSEIADIEQQMRHFRGGIEGGLCVREFEPLEANTEERCFVVDGKVFLRPGVAENHPEVARLAHFAAQKVDALFFSVDIALHEKGKPRIIELGDGQVSDLKKWNLEEFALVLQHLTMR